MSAGTTLLPNSNCEYITATLATTYNVGKENPDSLSTMHKTKKVRILLSHIVSSVLTYVQTIRFRRYTNAIKNIGQRSTYALTSVLTIFAWIVVTSIKGASINYVSGFLTIISLHWQVYYMIAYICNFVNICLTPFSLVNQRNLWMPPIRGAWMW